MDLMWRGRKGGMMRKKEERSEKPFTGRRDPPLHLSFISRCWGQRKIPSHSVEKGHEKTNIHHPSPVQCSWGKERRRQAFDLESTPSGPPELEKEDFKRGRGWFMANVGIFAERGRSARVIYEQTVRWWGKEAFRSRGVWTIWQGDKTWCITCQLCSLMLITWCDIPPVVLNYLLNYLTTCFFYSIFTFR